MLHLTLGSTATDVANAVASVPQVISLTRQIYDVNTATSAGRPTPTKPTGPTDYRAGVGLDAAVMPLQLVLYVSKNRWVVPASIAAVIGVPFLLGLLAGRATKRST